MWLYVPSVCAQGSGELTSASAESLAQFVTWRGKHSPPQSWQQRFKRVPWIRLLSGLTCAPSTLQRGVAAWISSLAATPANPSPSQGSDEAPKTSGTSGPKSLGSSSSAELPSASSRTSLGISLRDYLRSWPTLPRAGSLVNGAVSRRPKLARRRSGTGSGSSLTGRTTWPTPDAGVRGGFNQGGSSGRVGPKRPTLEHLGKTWPTPSVKGNYNRQGLSERSGDGLATAAKRWATPTARDGKGPRGKHTKGGRDLSQDASKWATPTTRDWKDSANLTEEVPTNHMLGRQAPRAQIGPACPQHSTRLSATFVEWLMGYPIGWTDLGALATPSSQTAHSQPSSSSCEGR